MESQGNNRRWIALVALVAIACGAAFYFVWTPEEPTVPIGTTVSTETGPETTPQTAMPTEPPAHAETVPTIEPASDIPETAAESSITISGTVRDKASREPIAGAKVQLFEKDDGPFGFKSWNDTEAETITDTNGQYSFSDIAAGGYTMFADARSEGYIARRADTHTFDFDGAESKTAVDIWLEKGGTVQGRIVNGSGVPVADAALTVMPGALSMDSFDSFLPVTFDPDIDLPMSSSDGKYTVSGIQFGSPVRVLARSEEYAMSRSRSFTLSATNPLVQVDFTLTGGSQVSGIVTYEDGAPAENKFVALSVGMAELMQGSFVPPEIAASDSNGRFVMEHIAAGTYTLSHTEDGEDADMFDTAGMALDDPDASTLIEVDGINAVSGLTVIVKRKVVGTGQITGTVLTADGAPAADIDVSAFHNAIYSHAEAKTDANGNFTLTQLNDGKYILHASNDGNTADRQDVLVGSHVTLRLIPDLKVSGRVIDTEGYGVPNARVGHRIANAEYNFSFGGSNATVNSDSNGDFTITGLDEGEFVLTASTTLKGSGTSEKFSLKRGREPPPVTITLIPGVKVSGIVTNAIGESIPGANVSIAPKKEGREATAFMMEMFGDKTASVNTDGEGRFTLTQIPDGTYRVTAKATGYSATKVEGIVVGKYSDVENIRVTLGKGGCVVGYALNDDRSPRVGNIIQLMGDNGQFMGNTDSDGRFEICSIPTGTYMIMAMDMAAMAAADDEMAGFDFAPRMVEIVDGETTEFTIGPPDNGVELTGIVRGEIGEMTMVSLRSAETPSYEDMDPTDMDSMMAMMQFIPKTAPIDSDGQFNFGLVEPGEYILEVRSTDDLDVDTDFDFIDEADLTDLMPGLLLSQKVTLEEGKPQHLELKIP
jgi:hypothetical protein